MASDSRGSTSNETQQTHPLNRAVGGSRGDKRLRSWEVDVSLDELVEWDA